MIGNIFLLIEEIEGIESERSRFLGNMQNLPKDVALFHSSSQGASKEQWLKSFDSRIFAILKQIDYHTSLIHEDLQKK